MRGRISQEEEQLQVMLFQYIFQKYNLDSNRDFTIEDKLAINNILKLLLQYLDLASLKYSVKYPSTL